MLLPTLEQYGITQIDDISYSLRTSNGILLSARYMGEVQRDRLKEFGQDTYNSGSYIGKSKIRIYSVAPEDEEAAKEALLKEALPLLCEWLREAEGQSYNWKRGDHSIVFRFKKGQLSMALDESGYW